MKRKVLISIDPEPEVPSVPSEPTALGILNWVSSNQRTSAEGGIIIETRRPSLSDPLEYEPWIPVSGLREYPSDSKSLRELQATIHGWFSSHDILRQGYREDHGSGSPWKVYEEDGIKYEQYGSFLRFKYPAVEPWSGDDARRITEQLQIELGV